MESIKWFESLIAYNLVFDKIKKPLEEYLNLFSSS